MRGITIREAAQRTGASAHTLRYYERAGLIGRVDRAADGKRSYSETDVIWLTFLRRLRATGMSVAQMDRFARLRAGGDAKAHDRRLLLEEHAKGVRGQIASLSENLEILERKIAHFRSLEEVVAARGTTVVAEAASAPHAQEPASPRSAR
jgi:DNA-binding transcriptional MerR regulator